MAYQFPPKVDELVKRQLGTGKYESEDEVLLDALQSLETQQEDWAAVSEALDTLEQRQQGLSLEEAFEVVRRKHSIPADA